MSYGSKRYPEASHRVSITRPTRGDGVEEVTIEIKSDANPVDRVVATMSLEEFARALTGLSERPALLSVRGEGIPADFEDSQIVWSAVENRLRLLGRQRRGYHRVLFMSTRRRRDCYRCQHYAERHSVSGFMPECAEGRDLEHMDDVKDRGGCPSWECLT
jgi:hypothetical protein